MKGVILAGGVGSRLDPLTRVTNKHLLPVYDRPMIYYPIQMLLAAGISEILIVTGGQDAGDFLKLLGNGQDMGLDRLEYTYQDGEGGIADALKLAEDFCDGGKMCVVLGDNLTERGIKNAVDDFMVQQSGARILLKQVPNPERFGVVRFDDSGNQRNIVEIVEKPVSPPSNYVVTGIYFYDADVFEFCRALSPSDRGELEITDVNNMYLNRGDLEFSMLDGWWTDAGTIESLFEAANLVSRGVSNGYKGKLS